MQDAERLMNTELIPEQQFAIIVARNSCIAESVLFLLIGGLVSGQEEDQTN